MACKMDLIICFSLENNGLNWYLSAGLKIDFKEFFPTKQKFEIFRTKIKYKITIYLVQGQNYLKILKMIKKKCKR